MKRLFLLSFFVFLNQSIYSQKSELRNELDLMNNEINLNAYKYIVIEDLSGDSQKWGVDGFSEFIEKTLEKKKRGKRKYNVVSLSEAKPDDLINNPALGLYIYGTYGDRISSGITLDSNLKFGSMIGTNDNSKVYLEFYDHNDNLLRVVKSNATNFHSSVIDALSFMTEFNYKFNPQLVVYDSSVSNNNLDGKNFNGYKYAYIPVLEYESGRSDIWGISQRTRSFFKAKGFELINSIEDIENPCEVFSVATDHTNIQEGVNRVTYNIYNCKGKVIDFWGEGITLSRMGDYRRATTKAFEYFSKYILQTYKFNSLLTPAPPNVETYDGVDINFSDEKSIRTYLSNNSLDDIEGIWRTGAAGSSYKLLILEDDYYYKAYIIEGSGFWGKGDLKATFEPIAVDNIFTLNWTMADKETTQETVVTLENRGLLKFNLRNTINNESIDNILYKVFPPLSGSDNTNKRNLKKGEWAGNGSGVIISESGYIVTNYHVIDDADEIEVEFLLNGELQKLNAEVVQVDKVNDLAIIKIFDMNFDGLDDIPYNFKSRSSDVGTTVYAYGYPMALSAMGKEIKVTDGIINAKSGFDGDITTYQISAPIQKGNSGGPLFDDKGNFLGINSAVIRKDIADNVGYTIKSSYVLNLIDVLPKNIDLPSSTKLKSLPLTEQIKEISKYVVLIKIK